MANKKKKTGFNLSGTNRKYGFRTVPNESVQWRLQSQDGKYFGDVSYDAYKAVESGTLGSYKAKNDAEKNIIAEYRKHPGITLKSQDGTEFGKISYDAYRAFTNNTIEGYTPHSETEKKAISDFKVYAEEKAKEERINSNPTFARYGIDPADFDYDDLIKWAGEHNHTMRVDGSMRTYFTPNYKGGFLGIGGKKLSTDQEDEDMEVLYQLANNNLRYDLAQTDMGAFMSSIVGFADGLSFGGISALSDWSTEYQYEKAGLNPDNLVKPSDMYAKTVNEHKIANIGGDIVGSVVTLGALGKGVSAATKGVKWISSSPQWVQSAINSGITFAVAGGTETAFDGGSLKDILMSTGTNFVGGAAGGAISSKVGAIGEKILFNKGLQHKIIPEMIRNGFSSAAFAGGKVASTYFLYPEEYRPTAEEMAKDIGVAFAFGAVSSGINTMKASAQNKKYLDDLYQQMASDYEKMAKANISNKSDITGIRKFAKNVIGYSNAMEAYLTGKEYNATIDGKTYTFSPNKVRLVGQDKYVNSILSELQTVRNNANAVLNGVGAPTTDLATTSTTPTSGTTVPAVVPSLPSGGGVTPETTTPVPPVVSNPVISADAATPVAPSVNTSGAVSTEQRNTFTGELDDIANTELPTVNVGDTFIDSKSNNIIKVIGRNESSTEVELTTPVGKKETKLLPNKTADIMAVDDKYTKVETSAPTVVENTVDVLQNQSQSATIKENTTNTVQDAGKSHTVAYTNDNQKIDLAYKVVSVDDLIASNDLNGNINPDYPQELQPRDRSRASSKSQISQMANNLNPARLAESTNVSEGAPIVGPDNVVESGNGRTLAIKLAYNMGTADAYRSHIINNAEVYGIDVSNLPENPVLVRERLTEVDRVEFTRKANESSIGSLSATEQARVDAEKLTGNVLNLLVANDDGVINTPANKDFITSVMANVFKSEDLNNVVNAEGMLSARGLERITNAIFYKAYGDSSLSARLSESLDNDMKNATKVLLNIAPKVVSIKNDIASGILYDFDFSEDIASAVRLFEKCRNENTTVAEYAVQTSLFGKEPLIIMEMAYVFETKNRGAKQATEFYNALLDEVINMGNPDQIRFDVAELYQTKEEIVDAAIRRYNNSEETTKPITVPESIYQPESESGRDDVGRGNDESTRNDTAEKEEVGYADRVQQDNRSGEETGIATDDEQLRQTNESVDGKSEVSKVEQKKKSTTAKTSGIKEIDTEALLGAVGNAKVGDEIKLSDYEKKNSNEQPSNTQPESDTTAEKSDLYVGDVIELDGKRWKVTSTGFNMSFENLDKNDKETSFSHIGGMESFKNTHDYKVITDKTPSELATATENEQLVNGTDKSKGTKTVAKFVAARLSNGKKVSAMELQKVANVAFGGTMADNAYSIKDAYDAMELGVNQHILSMKEVSADKMLEILELLPTQTKRTEEMVKFQQFSTPPSIAYLANYTANVNANDIMLEPSAGIGGIAVFAKKDGAKVYVNELDSRRLDVLKNMPFDGFFNEDAEQLNNILGGELEPTVIVMNPPFSSSSERNMKNTKIGAKHIEQALKILAPNGRLVAIVGNGMADGAPAFRNWWKEIKSQYNVRANIGINGKNYNKYGTNFDIQMLVIDKDGPTTQTETGYVDTLQELQEKLGGIRDERPAIDYSANEQRTPATTRKETVAKGKTSDDGNSPVSDTSSVANGRKSADVSRPAGKPDAQDIQSVDTERGKPASVKPESTDVVADENGRVGSGQSDGLAGEENSGRVDNSNSGQPDIQTGRTEPRKRIKRKELTDSIFEQYQTQPLRVANAQPHPAKVSESAAMSAIEPPPITYKPNIQQDIIDKGVVSAVQLEAISYAGQSHSQTLPNGTTRGFFLGDGTGIGKGRTIAGMMLDNYNRGRKKAVWVTLNSSLVNDAKRDVKALFGDSDLVMQFEGGEKANKIFDKDEAILVVSYSALSRAFDKPDSNFEKIVKWLGKDHDGLIVFDEAHKMGNATATKGARGVKKASQTGTAGIALQEALPKARVVYSSATGATEVENLRYAERLGLWGEGTPFVKGDDFVSKVKAGGLAAMELIARDMKAMGVYLSRNISYDDVQYDKITHKLTTPQTKIYDELARSWQIVLQNINKALESTNQDKDGHARGRALGAFWSSQQRFFNQILTSMQVPSVISDIEKQLADGKSCVIQLVSTNESAQNQEFERLKSEELDLDEFDLTPKQVLMSLIENSFPVQQFEEYIDDNGNKRSKPIVDSQGKPVLNRDAVRQREELLTKLGSIKVPSSPIEMIINHFGTDLVAENTGRARRVIQKDGKTIEEKISNKKDADVDAFQNGNKRIIIFSKAGGTGKSYHADRSAKNQQQRVHYLLEAGWQADNAVQGFGRSHRSNQASAPIFKLVTTDLKGQMRFISTIAKRLDQLGAMTKGQRQAGGQGMFSASDNLENSFAADVLSGFYRDLTLNRVDGIDDGLAILEKLGLKSKILDEYNRLIPTAPELREVNKFLNRILSLESAEQNTVFEGYSERLQDATEKALQAGTLDKGLENYKAERITLNEVQDIREDERSGAKTKYYNLTAEHKIKPVTFDKIPTESKSFVGFYRNKNTGNVRAVMQTSSSTDKYGNVTSNYKLIGQIRPEYIPQHRLYGNWVEIKADEAEKVWNEELTKLPEYRKENLHLISGVVLPVWDKLPTENVRIYRVLTSDGEMLIGRVVSEDMIDETLRRLGSSRKKEKIATNDLITSIKNGDKVYLENDWMLTSRKVSGENRIELLGPSYEHNDMLMEKGVFTERIQYRTRYFVPADTNTEKIIDDILKISPVMRVESEKFSYSLESEKIYGQERNLLHNDSEQWYAGEYPGEQVAGLAKATESGSKTAEERKAYTKALKTNQLDKKVVTDKDGNKHMYVEIKQSAWNGQMNTIADYYAQKDVNVHFLKGGVQIAFVGEDKTANAMRIGNDIYISYDHAWYTPEQLSMHEYIHIKYESPEFQQIAQDIIATLPKKEYNKLVDQVKKAYGDIIENPNAYEVELICDILSGMTPSSLLRNGEIVLKFWAKESADLMGFDTAQYADSIDAGGVNSDILDGIGFGNDFKLSDNIDTIPHNEHVQLEDFIIDENYSNELKPFSCKEIGNNFYVWKNLDKNNYKIEIAMPIMGNDDIIELMRSGLNGINKKNEGISHLYKSFYGRYGNGDRSSIANQNRQSTSENDRLLNATRSERQADIDGRRNLRESYRDTSVGKIDYSFSSVDDDIAELTPERKKEIFEQFERDRAGVDKPTQKQIWGERAEWIAHNMTRVFPEIPERGEKGTFFAEFRKMMIQWKALPQTSMFMTQDKLNQMTKDLTPDEFKTFSELVYFLDLQEEAQIQKERGYTEILLPNEITPHEVDQIVDILNTEATSNVKNALDKRRQIWDGLKEQYITLNQYVGFDVSDRFNRKNYYHHQVIEYMNQGGKGVAKGKDIEIKAGRGWLKERQGSTKATNTDFLAVEYKAMLQMQYDIYVANMLGKIKDQYDIKPQLEKQAFNNNKTLLNDIIKKECTDAEGKVMLDSKGKPDSETYRQQQWYNQRIMYGFSGLFDLAEAGMLPTFNGQYDNIIRALETQRLNAPGLYNYVGELASMELPETATDEELQARISARTVLKYTAQKKAWVKETLAGDYQTWETLANDMKDTHSIHQPRRGNYFYTKTTVDEDAFNKAFNDMIVGLVAGENGIDTTADMKKLFEQYSETVRLMGAAYEQWVIPNEIETTMNKVANPKQAGVVSQGSRALLSAWKGWATSVNPLRTIKFGIRNMIGDLDAVIAGNPKVVVYSKQAVHEIYQAMKHKKYSDDFMGWIERGGYSSLIFANEMDTEMQDKLFSHLKDKEGLNIFKIPAKFFEGYYNGVESAHNFREAILRYSAYLYFKNEIIKNDGKVKDNVASNRYIVKGLKSVEDKAYQLSKDLLGAYDEVATMGQALRRHAIPFYSFTETNLKRYYRLFENIIASDDKIPKKAGKLLLKGLMVNLLGLLMVAWNQLVMKDEDEELPPSVRNVPHITLGKFGDVVYAFRQVGSFSELLEWVGLEDYQWTEEDKTAALDKAVGMITPVIKTPVELLTGLNFYPSITQPRAIRDKVEHLFSTLGVDDVYRVAAGKPTKGIVDIAKGAVTYSYDYKESAYYEILDIKREYQGDTDNTIYGQTPKSNALYYMKTAIRYKDKEAALKYLDKYFENGGTAKGIAQSIEMLNPLYGYTGKETIAKGQEFVKSLSDDEKDKLKIALDYYENDLMLPENVSSQLRKKGITDEQAKNLLTNYINSKCK